MASKNWPMAEPASGCCSIVTGNDPVGVRHADLLREDKDIISNSLSLKQKRQDVDEKTYFGLSNYHVNKFSETLAQIQYSG